MSQRLRMLYQELGYAFPTSVACPYESDFELASAVDQNGTWSRHLRWRLFMEYSVSLLFMSVGVNHCSSVYQTMRFKLLNSIHVSVGVNPCSSIQRRRLNSNHRSPSAKEPRRPPSPSRHRARLIIVFATATRIGILISRSRDEMRTAPIQGHGNSFGDRRPPSARMSRPAAKSI